MNLNPCRNATSASASAVAILLACAIAPSLVAQPASQPASQTTARTAAQPLDPARDPARLHRVIHQPLPEQYIWTANDAAALKPGHEQQSYTEREKKTGPHAFRASFTVSHLPAVATLYIAGPRTVKAYLNSTLVLDESVDMNSPLNSHVLRAEVTKALHIGRNTLAIEAIRGRGIVAASDAPEVQQMAYGETLVAKIVPAAAEIDAPALVQSSPAWRSTATPSAGWQQPEFDDHAWPSVQALGAIEANPGFYQWNLDAGMYDWPGYIGMSSYLQTYSLGPQAITHITENAGSFSHLNALTVPDSKERFTVRPAQSQTGAPGLLLDFGREVAGRLLVQSACNCQSKILLSYGESESEALTGSHYLGTVLLQPPANGLARGPKSGFRYAWLRFTVGDPETRFQSIRLEGIAYPVTYQGSFESSDPQLNRIWETAAHTAHLCMQDGIWDAPKRDRGWWVGDLDASGPVIGDVFGDSFLMEETLNRLIPPTGQHVNGIPGYTTLWITALADLYRHRADTAYLVEKHAVLLDLLKLMDTEFDPSGQFLNKQNRWLFVDWSANLYASTDEAAEGTELEFVRGYSEGAWLLRQLNDTANAAHFESRAGEVSAHARAKFSDPKGLYGSRLQLNAMAILAGVAEKETYPTLWQSVLSHADDTGPQAQTISPYFNNYLLQAMAQTGHRREALNWMRAYWGGMLDEGATSFWEAYDRRWPKLDPHTGLQADGQVGYFVSLAHGWSSGPAAWLMEQILGIQSKDAGFRKVTIRPDLVGLDWAKGQVPTPHGLIRVEMRQTRHEIQLTLPTGVTATVLVPVTNPGATVGVNGATVASTSAEEGTRAVVILDKPGTYKLVSK